MSPSDAVTLTPGAAFFIAGAFARWLGQRGDGNTGSGVKVAVGHDPRVTAPLLLPATLAGLGAAGAACVSVGLSTTPAMFYSLIEPGSDVTGSIMLTASHMPMQNNGLKFFTRDGGLSKGDISEIIAAAAADADAAGVSLGSAVADAAHVLAAAVATPAVPGTAPLLQNYAAHLRRQMVEGIRHPAHPDAPLTGLRIAVDAGNGSGGFFATQVLAPLGADVSGSQFLEPDGTFPNHIPNPEAKAAMDAAVHAVKQSGADLGIVFDTDVDRSAIVSGDGTPINSNRFIALMAAIVLQEHPGSTIVTDSVTSNGLTTFIEARGGRHFRFKRGYRNVINKGIELNQQGVDCELMMETSGHGAMRSNHYLDDGSHLALTAVVAFVRSRLLHGASAGLGELLADLQEPLEASEHRITIKGSDAVATGTRVLVALKAWLDSGAAPANWSLAAENHEGWRINVDEGVGAAGWLLLRQSLHDPLLVLNLESDIAGGAAIMRGQVAQFLSSCDDAAALDLSSLA